MLTKLYARDQMRVFVAQDKTMGQPSRRCLNLNLQFEMYVSMYVSMCVCLSMYISLEHVKNMYYEND